MTSTTELLVYRKKLFLITLSCAMILIIFVNLSTVRSSILGASTSVIYILINGTFLGCAFFKEEKLFFRLALGIFCTTGLLGLVGWLAMIAYNLDLIRTIIVLSIVATTSFLIRTKVKNPKKITESRSHFQPRLSAFHAFINILYLILAFSSVDLLFLSQKGEVYIVWTVLHPAFIPIFFAATLALVTIILSSQKVEYKLALVIVHSILSHSFFSITFPAGDVGGQQYVLGRAQLVYQNVVTHGIGISTNNPLTQAYLWFRGDHFQVALSTMLARMFSVDISVVHLALIPVLWGVFIPLGMFLITRILSRNEKISVLAALLISLFPYTFLWGAVSVYNSLGYIFFLYALYAILKYLSPNHTLNYIPIILMFSLLSFLSHFLTGIISLSFLIIATAFKTRQGNARHKSFITKAMLLSAFLLSLSLLPLALVYRRFFYSEYAYFGLGKLIELNREEIIWTFLIEGYFNLSVQQAIVYGIGPLLGFFGIMYYLYINRHQHDKKMVIYAQYFLTSFIMLSVVYRILKLFMLNVPFNEERIWVFRDFLAVPFMTILVVTVFSYLYRLSSNSQNEMLPVIPKHLNAKNLAISATIVLLVSGWIITSVYYAYPQWAPLQTTSYELEAVKYIDQTTQERYIVVCDQWIIFAGQMFVGINNPQAFYFSHRDPSGISLNIQMKTNPTNQTLIEAMKINNATTAYFIIEKLRLGVELYESIINQAQENNLQTYKIFYYPESEEKLRIFRYPSKQS